MFLKESIMLNWNFWRVGVWMGRGGGGFKLKKPSMSDGAGRFVEHKKACNVIDAQGTLRAILVSCVLFKLPKCICCITLIGPLQLGS